jgi:hypothetical protein
MEKQEMKREEVARRSVEVNSLAVVRLIMHEAAGMEWS